MVCLKELELILLNWIDKNLFVLKHFRYLSIKKKWLIGYIKFFKKKKRCWKSFTPQVFFQKEISASLNFLADSLFKTIWGFSFCIYFSSLPHMYTIICSQLFFDTCGELLIWNLFDRKINKDQSFLFLILLYHFYYFFCCLGMSKCYCIKYLGSVFVYLLFSLDFNFSYYSKALVKFKSIFWTGTFLNLCSPMFF